MSLDGSAPTEASGSLTVAGRLPPGARNFDPVRVHFLETLAQRMALAPEASRPLLHSKLEQGIATFQAEFQAAQAQTQASLEALAAKQPQAADPLHSLWEAGDFKQVQRSLAAHPYDPQNSPLRALSRYLAEQSHGPAPAPAAYEAAPRTELRAVRQFRSTWSKLSTQKQLHSALEQAPKNAGPINSHSLVLRSLALMRDISPDYLSRFMTYADTLLCLDEASQSKPEQTKIGAAPAAAKKTRARRAR